MSHSIIYNKAEDFAVRIVNLWKYLKTKDEYDMSLQLKRSGTSIGANIAEALCGVSNRDFINKLSIAQKECQETLYWLRLLTRTNYLTKEEFTSIEADQKELSKILAKIIKSCKEKAEREDSLRSKRQPITYNS
jgi:four helix bundle protein